MCLTIAEGFQHHLTPYFSTKEVIFMGNISKKQLIDQVAEKSDVTKTDVNSIIDAFTEIVKDNVAKNKKVQLMGFGSFELRHRAARKGRNPRTGEEIKIAATNVPGFKPGKPFKDAVNK